VAFVRFNLKTTGQSTTGRRELQSKFHIGRSGLSEGLAKAEEALLKAKSPNSTLARGIPD
jgi:hypothetical protein